MELPKWQVYYKLRDIAKTKSDNIHSYNVSACVIVGKSRFYGWNSYNTHPKAARRLHCSGSGSMVTNYCYHAETHALLKAMHFTNNIKSASVIITRVLSDGRFTMAKPCEHCQKTMKIHGISPSKIKYTNWDGEFVILGKYDY